MTFDICDLMFAFSAGIWTSCLLWIPSSRQYHKMFDKTSEVIKAASDLIDAKNHRIAELEGHIHGDGEEWKKP